MSYPHLEYGLDQSKLQIEKVFEGIGEAELDMKLTDQAMTPREILEHLCECYHAVITEAAGGKHEWGTYSIEDKSFANLTKQAWSLRAQAAQAALDKGDEEAAMYAFNYIILHDAYHVGQMCLVRMKADPNWNAYAIYGE